MRALRCLPVKTVNRSRYSSMKVMINQSIYLPWKGFFDMLAQADCYIIYDSVQFSKRSVRNRQHIKTAQGLHWLTIPTHKVPRDTSSIDDIITLDEPWIDSHLKTIEHSYRNAPHYDFYQPLMRESYDFLRDEQRLSYINEHLIRTLCDWLDIKVKICPRP